MADANHAPGRFCSRYGCQDIGETDTPMGRMCAAHRAPLMFQIQRPWHETARFVPWEFVEPHDRQAQRNHGGQTLARLSERGGLTADELAAVLLGRGWVPMSRERADAIVNDALAKWRAS